MSDKNKGRVTLYLMRHGQTILNKVGRTQGWCDGVLTKEGIEVAVNTGLGLIDVKFKAVYSSDLGRAIKTAQIVIKENKASGDLELKEFEGLREVYFGKYEGEFEKIKFKAILDFLNVTSFEEMAERYDFQRAYCDSCAALDETHEAENYNTALKRFVTTINNICIENEEDGGGNILIVVHGGMLRVFIEHLDKNFDIRNMDNSSISKVVYENGKFKVQSVNDSSYSEKGKAMRQILK